MRYKHKRTGIIAEPAMSEGFYNTMEKVLSRSHIHKSLIENSDDWEKIIDGSYEIMSFEKNNNTGLINNKNSWQWTVAMSEEINNSENRLSRIYSIRRFSDNQIFTIGDHTPGGQISKFEIITDTIKFTTSSGYSAGLEVMRLENPLFVTEDGVTIYKYSKGPLNHGHFPTVDIANDYKLTNCANQSPIATHRVHYNNFKIFSTNEAAIEYIVMNKPCLSIADLIDEKNQGQNVKDTVRKKLNI